MKTQMKGRFHSQVVSRRASARCHLCMWEVGAETTGGSNSPGYQGLGDLVAEHVRTFPGHSVTVTRYRTSVIRWGAIEDADG